MILRWVRVVLAALVPCAALAAECKATRGGPVPRVRPELESAAFWLGRYGRDADRVLLDEGARRALDRHVTEVLLAGLSSAKSGVPVTLETRVG